jgi:tetratricopeptide (TPR) repeat protein
MKTVTAITVWLLAITFLSACREKPAETDPLTFPTRNTVIGQLYHSNQIDALFHILPTFLDSTEVGSPAWIEMENVVPHACKMKSMRFVFSDTGNRQLWLDRADSAWAAVDTRRGLGPAQEFARMQLWQNMEQWPRIVQFVKTHPTHQSIPHCMDLYLTAKLELADTSGFLDQLQTANLYEWDIPILTLQYHELAGNDETVQSLYTQLLSEKPGNSFLLIHYAEYLADHGDYETALATVEQARELSRGMPGYHCSLYALRAHIHYLRGDYEAATADSTLFAYVDSLRANLPDGTRLY